MKPLKILLSINVRWWNAEAAYAVNVARGFLHKGHQVQLIVNENSPAHQKAEKLGIPVITDIQLDSNSPYTQLKNLRKILRLIDQEGIDTINSFKSNGSVLFNLAKKFRPHITYIKTRGEARPPRKSKINSWLYGSSTCDGIITVGKVVESWVKELDLQNQRIKTIYYGDTPTEYDIKESRRETRSAFGIAESDKVLALVGRTQRVKGHLLLLKAMALLQDPSFQLFFLVKDLDEYPEELRELKEFIQKNQLTDQVKIFGFREDLGKVLRCVDLGVIPSTASEVNCRVAVEFFSMGVPVLSFPTGTLPDIIEHHKNGYLCQDKTERDLLEGIRSIFTSEIPFQEYRDAAERSFLEKYTLEKFYEETYSFYQECSQ